MPIIQARRRIDQKYALKQEYYCIMNSAQYYDIQTIKRYQKLILQFDYITSTSLNTTPLSYRKASNIQLQVLHY